VDLEASVASVRGGECQGVWAFLLHHVVLQDDIQDHWRWLIDPIHGYTVRGTYRFLTSSDDYMERSTVSNVWHKLVPSKVSLFAWRLLQNRIPTKSNLVHRRVLQPNVNLCVGGYGFIETADHLFLRCDLFGSVWGLVCQWLGVSHVSPSSIPEHFLQFVHLAGLPHATNCYLKVIWLGCVWALWKERNNCIFNNASLDPLLVVKKVKLHSFFFCFHRVLSLSLLVFMIGGDNHYFVWVLCNFCLFLFLVVALCLGAWFCKIF